MSWRSWSARVALQLLGRQESFQDSRVSALTSEGRVGAIPLELQGMDSANSLFGKNREAT